MRSRPFLFLGALFAGLAVVFGAFGAHALKGVLDRDQLAVWQTAVTYQMWHALGLILVARVEDDPCSRWSGRLMAAGILLFSGSLYLMVLSGTPALGMITPFGGLAFIGAWFLLAWSAWRRQDA